ncbi:hypothetical protein F5Y18DRAFT_420580 [Xylariaceae sp. FL1019]|nr:hypothetical protein F5Y18DRAFT_420580 [Xylariaceae sp. FL1019]
MAIRPSHSAGCFACRRMKVKCDGQRPRCTRCGKANRVCPGYRDTSDIQFRSMNETVTAKCEGFSLTSNRMVDTMSRPTPLIVRPSTAWETNATSHFLHDYSFNRTKHSPGYLNFLPELLSSASCCEQLKSAVLAAGCASLRNTTGLNSLQGRAYRYYGKSLNQVLAASGNSSQAGSDANLTAIIVLQHYEAISDTADLPDDPHSKGLSELLRRRRETTVRGHEVARMVRSRQQINEIGGDAPSRHEPRSQFDFATAELPQKNIWQLLPEVSRSCGELHFLLSSQILQLYPHHMIINAINRVSSAYQSLAQWQSGLPSGRLYQSFTIPEDHEDATNQVTKFPLRYHIFKDVQQGAVWICFWCAQVYLLQTLVKAAALPSLQKYFKKEASLQWGVEKQLHSVIDNICASVPYMMDDIDQMGLPKIATEGKALGAFFLTRGLYVANSMSGLTDTQRSYILETFERIGHVRGIRLALRARVEWMKRQISKNETGSGYAHRLVPGE